MRMERLKIWYLTKWEYLWQHALDGIGTHTGHVLIVTTNVKPDLDPALTRPGRIDNEYEFRNPDASTIESCFCFFFETECPSSDSTKRLRELAKKFAEVISHTSISPARIQEYFLRCNENPETAVANVAKLVQSRSDNAWEDLLIRAQ